MIVIYGLIQLFPLSISSQCNLDLNWRYQSVRLVILRDDIHGETYFHKYLCFNLVSELFIPPLSTQTICVALSVFSLLGCMFVSPLLSTELLIVTDGYTESPLFPGR